MTMYLERIKAILKRFDEKEQEELKAYYIQKAVNILVDERSVNKSKIQLLMDLRELESEENFTTLSNKLMSHKVLQARALVLDLIATDYTKDTKAIYRAEDWVKEIVGDIKESFDLKDERNLRLLKVYNEKMVGEFESIFISENTNYGSAGNQLLVDLTFYARFMEKFVSFSFMPLLTSIKNQIEPSKVLPEKEIDEILKGDE